MSHKVLMLEPDEDDRFITQSFFKENNYDVDLTFATDSRELTLHLQRWSTPGSELPSLILLNYHAFPTDGLGVLRDLKSNEKYSHIPVVVLSGTARKDVIRKCYEHGASSFIKKPSSSSEDNRKISNFFKYWFETVELG